ncbi:MAG TPA: RDD family protein [Polyangiaceae bacterium]|nr:RDD family protein [Polyangiaceae bacterium]
MNEQVNPFEPPAADWVPNRVPARSDEPELASFGARFTAALIDALLVLTLVFPLQLYFGVFKGFPEVREQGWLESAAWAGLGFAIWLALNGYLLKTSGQSIGKRLLGIRIANLGDDRPPSFFRIAVLRELPFRLVSLLPDAGTGLVLLDPLAIFKKDRRCIHDHIARTRVIVLPRPPNAAGP